VDIRSSPDVNAKIRKKNRHRIWGFLEECSELAAVLVGESANLAGKILVTVTNGYIGSGLGVEEYAGKN
jgi:hypothetical protein